MTELLLGVCIVLLVVVVVLQVTGRRSAGSPDGAPILSRLDGLERTQERTERSVKDELGRLREDGAGQARGLREEVGGTLKGTSDTVVRTIGQLAESQGAQLKGFSEQIGRQAEANEKKLEELRKAVEERLRSLQEDNARKIEEMRRTVDEKLQGTLEKRLGESFKLVSDRLEQVHKGLGEMQTLANGVGDLKKVLTNVKSRGTWGEIQLGNLLEQVLTPEQYERNVAVRANSNDRVEFAIKLPGRGEDGKPVWLPIDSKFPKEDYERLVEAADRSDPEGVETAVRQVEARIKAEARLIHDKYIAPPETTDFAIMFLPSEGLYAEVLRRPGLVDHIQREFRINVTGPTTLGALLNSLQMGFRTLAIEKRSGEVVKILGAVKTEFGKFGGVLESVKKKIEEAGNAIDDASVRTRAMVRNLKSVEELPVREVVPVLKVVATDEESGDVPRGAKGGEGDEHAA
jgi:DNA recombination protein RmuC